MTRLLALLTASCLSAVGCANGSSAPREPTPVVPPPVNAARTLSQQDAEGLAEFNRRVTAYAELHRTLEADLPALPKETTPEVITAHQRALEKAIRSRRRNAAQGDLFTPAARRVFRRAFARVFTGADGRQLKATIMDENPGRITLTVNSRYPDQVPLSTVPPQVLSALPTLPEELEYRFIGERLILLDVHAHTIADFMDNVFPS